MAGKFNSPAIIEDANNGFPEQPKHCMKTGCKDKDGLYPESAKVIFYIMRDNLGKKRVMPFTGDKNHDGCGTYDKQGKPKFREGYKFEGHISRCDKCYYDDLFIAGKNHMARNKFKQEELSPLQHMHDNAKSRKEYLEGLK